MHTVSLSNVHLFSGRVKTLFDSDCVTAFTFIILSATWTLLASRNSNQPEQVKTPVWVSRAFNSPLKSPCVEVSNFELIQLYIKGSSPWTIRVMNCFNVWLQIFHRFIRNFLLSSSTLTDVNFSWTLRSSVFVKFSSCFKHLLSAVYLSIHVV